MTDNLNICKDNLFRLDGKVAVVTGGLGILGKRYCRALADRGAEVIIADIDQSDCDKLSKILSSETGANVFGFSVDLSSEKSIVEWTKRIIDKLGHVDVLVNNAAAKANGFFAPLEKYTSLTWEEVMAVNVNSVFLTVRELGPIMANQGSGSIINVSSIYGVVAPDQRIYEGSWYEDLGGAINTPMIYSVSKGAIIAMTRYLATYWGGNGVRCNCITPGGVYSGQNEQFEKEYSFRVPLGRMAKEEDMIGGLVYLASDASSYVNGHNLIIDGGWTSW